MKMQSNSHQGSLSEKKRILRYLQRRIFEEHKLIMLEIGSKMRNQISYKPCNIRMTKL